jgi:pimeloyl-ACP methyl ester carboxylesterase
MPIRKLFELVYVHNRALTHVIVSALTMVVMHACSAEQTTFFLNNGGASWYNVQFPDADVVMDDAHEWLDYHVMLPTGSRARKVPVRVYDRKSSTALIIGQGFPGTKESMRFFARLFPFYDVVTYDYRWRPMWKFVLRPSTWRHPMRRFVDDEGEVVAAVVRFTRSLKSYERVIGLGCCYSNFLFMKLQAAAEDAREKCFDALILDSCWHSYAAFAESISYDPWLPINPQEGGCPELIKKVLRAPLIHKTICKIICWFAGTESIEKYAVHVHHTPVLFIHGACDKMVPLHTFERIFNAVSSQQKIVCITPFQHSDNTQNKYAYQCLVQSFVDSISSSLSSRFSHVKDELKAQPLAPGFCPLA